MMVNLMLFGWPLVMIVLARTLPWPQALVISILGGYLLLPEQGMWFDPPLLPPIDKALIPALVAVALALILRPGAPARGPGQAAPAMPDQPLPGWLPRSGVAITGLTMVLLGMVATALTNGDTLTFALTDYTRPALRLYDGIALAVAMLPMLLPFVLGRKYLGHPDRHRMILWALAIAGVIYTLPALWEIRMSPRLTVQFYGFFPHTWHQHIRSGGFRPIVFLPHGLFLALFFAMATIALSGLARAERQRRGVLLLGAAWVLLTLALSNSLTGLLIALALCPVVLLAGVRLQLTLAAAIAAFMLLYPALRMAELVPTERFVTIAERINPARGASLNFRFENEELILDHVRERQVLGWGGYGRNRIYDERGRGVDTVDSSWIVALGVGGWVRFIGLFGLLCAPVIMLWRHRARWDVTAPTAVLCVMLAGNMIDLIPNSGLTPLSWLIVGALFGRIELGRIAETATQHDAQPARAAPYTRAPPDPDRGPEPVAANPYTRQSGTHVRPSRRETA
jgi:hypothetical protein